MESCDFSLVIPCFNEGPAIEPLAGACLPIVAHPGVEVIFVDNGSRDDTFDQLSQFTRDVSNMRVVQVEVNRGYGWGILQGLERARGRFLGWTHADLQTDPLDALDALGIMLANPDVGFVKGRRRGRSWSEKFFSVGMGLFESGLLGTWMTEINAQPTVFTKTFYDTWQNPPHDFSLDLYAYHEARRQSVRIERLDVVFPNRPFGHSKWNIDWRSRGRFIKRTVDYSLALRRRG